MPYWQLYYHLVWATYKRVPLILPDLKGELFAYLRGKAVSLGCYVHAVGEIADHVHAVMEIPPHLAAAGPVGRVKGASSHWVNHRAGATGDLQWQEGYGAFSFDRRALPFIVRYVQEQRRRHEVGRLIPIMEQIEEITGSFLVEGEKRPAAAGGPGAPDEEFFTPFEGAFPVAGGMGSRSEGGGSTCSN